MHEIRWTVEKIENRINVIRELVYKRRMKMSPFRYSLYHSAVPDHSDIIKDDSSWEELSSGTYWGKWKTNFILQTKFNVPEEFREGLDASLYLPLGESGDFSHPEGLLYIDGEAAASCDRHHQEILIPGKFLDGKEHVLTIYGWTGLGGFPVEDPDSRLMMRECSIVIPDKSVRAFIVTAVTALETVKVIGTSDPARSCLLNALDNSFKVLDTREPLREYLYKSLDSAGAVLRDGIAAAGIPKNVSVIAAGHAHLDVAWLWTLEQTRGKASRTFHNVIHLMKEFPSFIFSQSQPQLYEYIKKDQPALFSEIKKHVAQGRWEPMGGMWVEADCNLSGPESLARQFILGRQFFTDNFGKDSDSKVLWLPDVFGYAGNLPQLTKLAGLDYFFTIKIGWNQYNRLPYDSFWWQGLDGTRMLTHFSSTPWMGAWFGNKAVSTYNSNATVPEVAGTWNSFQQKEFQSELLMAFGQGDGGGGPTREMLESIKEMESFPSLPRVSHGRVGEFFENMEKESGDKLPVWNGELYLELHRGTYTTQGRTKKANRKSEFLLHDTEFLGVAASIIDSGYNYPHSELEKAWKLVCLNQFHDIIPGSSVAEVYEDSMVQYSEIDSICRGLISNALEVLERYFPCELLLINTTGFRRDEPVFLPGPLEAGTILRDNQGRTMQMQKIDNGTLFSVGFLEPSSLSSFFLVSGTSDNTGDTGLRVEENLLENNFIRIELDEKGEISGIFDKISLREVLPEGSVADQLQAFEDRPLEWDAWDIEAYFDDKMWTEKERLVRVVESGPLRGVLKIEGRILHSEYVKYISLDYNSSQINFRMKIDWKEKHILLKTAFPVDVLSSSASYEIQWGNVERPTHKNTSWDWARFETCAQKWVDLSEGDYGVSLLNDCKYGHDIQGNIIRLSLLRSPVLPDPEADTGVHEFSYSLLPHSGRWDEDTIRGAYLLNDPVLVHRNKKRENQTLNKDMSGKSLFKIDRRNIILETVKMAEGGEGNVLRLYESMRMRGTACIEFPFNISKAWKTNLMEEEGEGEILEVEGRSLKFSYRPFEIITIKFTKE